MKLKEWLIISEKIGKKPTEFIQYQIDKSPLGEEEEVTCNEDELLQVLIGIHLGLAEWKDEYNNESENSNV